MILVNATAAGARGLALGRPLGRRTVARSAAGRAPVGRGVVSPGLPVPAHIVRPAYAANASGSPERPDTHFEVQDTPDKVRRLRAACALAASVLERALGLCTEGTTTDEIDAAVHAMVVDAGAYPSPLLYKGFPKSVCTSVNEVVCHGIPDSRPLRRGDLVNVDVTVFLEGMHGDTSATMVVGGRDAGGAAGARLVRAAEEALEAGVGAVKPGLPISGIGLAIEAYARERGYGVVSEGTGHGVGEHFHVPPYVFHVANSYPGALREGMSFTIEPMLTERPDYEIALDANDGWTVVTKDGQLSAQFEHTVLVTAAGVEVLTARPPPRRP